MKRILNTDIIEKWLRKLDKFWEKNFFFFCNKESIWG